MKREEVGVRKTAEREGGSGRNGCHASFKKKKKKSVFKHLEESLTAETVVSEMD